MISRHAIDDALTRAMADRLFDTGADLADLAAVVRTLQEGRFLAREIEPRLGLACLLARSRYGRIVERRRAA